MINLGKFRWTFFIFIFLLILTFTAGWPLVRRGFYESHDGEWMVIRLSAFHQSLADGHFPVRWVERLNHGYGYPVMNFLYPLPFYLGEVFHLLGLSLVDSIKSVFLLSIFFSGLFMFLFVKRIFGLMGGFISAAFYIFVPYRFVDIYARGSVGEALAFVFIPLLFLSIYRLSRRATLDQVILGAIAVFGLITSHNVIAFVFIFPALIYWLFKVLNSSAKNQVIFSHLLLILWGLSLSAFFWLPALYDLRFVIQPNVEVANVFEHLLSLSDLIIPRWGFGAAKIGDPSSISFQIGALHLLVFLLSIPALVFSLRNKKVLFREIIPFQIIFILSLFLMLSYSRFIWQAFSPLSVIQFPWRMLSITAFSSAFLAGGIFSLVGEKFNRWVFALLILLLVGSNFSYIRPKNFINRPESFYTTNEDSTTVRDEFLPIWVKNLPKERPRQKIEFSSSQAVVREEELKTGRYRWEIIPTTGPLSVQINTVFFPGWRLFVNGKEKMIDPHQGKGLITFDWNSRESKMERIELKFKETLPRLIADLISVAGIGLIFFSLMFFQDRGGANNLKKQ